MLLRVAGFECQLGTVGTREHLGLNCLRLVSAGNNLSCPGVFVLGFLVVEYNTKYLSLHLT